MKKRREKESINASNSPRFSNTGNFMRIDRVNDPKGLDFAIYGIPFDTATSYRPGARFGPQAIRNISVMLKPNNLIHKVNILEHLKGADMGDVNIVPGYIHESYHAIEKFTSEILEAGAIPIALGGDHSITLAELRAVAKKHGPVSLIQFDSHADINDEVFGEEYSHGTPFRRAVEENLIDPKSSIQIGLRGSLYDLDKFEITRELGFKTIAAHEVNEMGIPRVIEEINRVVGKNKTFLTFDIDFFDPAYAPGTGTPEVGGYTSSQGLEFIRGLKAINFVGFDIVEVAPPYDHAEITSLLAANIVFEFLSILALQKNNSK